MADDRNLPALPTTGGPLDLAAVEALEDQVVAALPGVDDLDTLEEWRAQAAALEVYLRAHELQGPMLGAQRRVEARIGQLLPDPRPGRRTDLEPPPHEEEVRGHFNHKQLHDFALLARALNGEVNLTDDQWRVSRRMLVQVVRGRLPPEPPAPRADAEEATAEQLRQVEFFSNALDTAHAGAREARRRAKNAADLGTADQLAHWAVVADDTARHLNAIRSELRRVTT